MGYIFDEWKKLLDTFQRCVDQELDEIHQQKNEVLQIKCDIFNRLDKGAYYRDEHRIVISAPEIIIGNVDKSGTLIGGDSGKVIIKGGDVELDGVGAHGKILHRAPIIHQIAVNPGIDGKENVVCQSSEIMSQACDIVLHSSDSKDEFSMSPVSAGKGGIRLHADKKFFIEAAMSARRRKEQIEATVATINARINEVRTELGRQRQSVDDVLDSLTRLVKKEEKDNDALDYGTSVNLSEINEIHEEMEMKLPGLYRTVQTFIDIVSELAELNRRKRALEEEKGHIPGDDFKNNTTGTSLSVEAEAIVVNSRDADGNLHTNPEAGITVNTPRVTMSMKDDKGELVKDGKFVVNAHDITLNTADTKDEGKERQAVGSINIQSETINMESLNYKMDKNNNLVEKELAANGMISLTGNLISVTTNNPQEIEKDNDGKKVTSGKHLGQGLVNISSKKVAVSSFDYVYEDGKLKESALTEGGKISFRTQSMDLLAADLEGKATGSVSINAKDVAIKSMDVDKEKLEDKALAGGSSMLLVSEKMFVGAKSKDAKSKKVQTVSEEYGAFADKTLEIQQGDGKAVVQLDGGNVSLGGSETKVYGKTTINADTEVKGKFKAPKAAINDVEVSGNLKSLNINDGIASGAPAGSGNVSAKIKTEDAPAIAKHE